MKVNFFIPKIPFPLRIILFTLCEIAGILLQVFLPPLFLLSLIIMISGSILVIARNYRNKPMDLGFENWKPASTTEFKRIEQNLKMTKKITYPFIYKGGFGVIVLFILVVVAFFSFIMESTQNTVKSTRTSWHSR